MPDGRRIRSGLLLRGGDLSRASDEDLAALSRKYRVAKVFDFRTSMEVRRAPDREVEGALNIWLPAFNEDSQTMAAMSLPQSAYLDLPRWLAAHASDPRVQDVASRLYTDMVIEEFTQIQYAGFLQNILNTEDGAVYWHCSQGKDRCGFGSAMVLAALGADKDLIIRDFALSNESYADLLDKIVGKAREMDYSDAEINTIYMLVGVSVDNFSKTMDMIEQRYGSLDEYLTTALDCDEEQRAMLRARFLE